ncbi:hypothetical protein KJ877_08575 [bacterium]|nr:hypothetical protein [bacterium]MBU1990750.1 hypothetical protein [bacterium]
MNTSYSLDAYRSHDLNIAMRTSSGDVIKMDFANEQSFSMRHSQDENTQKSSLSFSSMHSFGFSIKSNGIDAQDQKEIDAFMKIAQPYIEGFLKELDGGGQKSSISKIAQQISDIFLPIKEKDEDTKNYAKNSIVKMFDDSIKQMDTIDKIFDDAQKLLEKTLQRFDSLHENIYA